MQNIFPNAEIRKAIENQPTVDICGIVSNTHFRILFLSEGNVVTFDFDCWRVRGGDLKYNVITLSCSLDHRTEQDFRDLLSPFSVIHVRGRFNEASSHAIIENIIHKYTLDQDLNEYAKILNSLFEFHDHDLGTFVWNKFCAFEGSCKWKEQSIELILDLEDIRDLKAVQSLCDIAKNILNSQNQWNLFIKTELFKHLEINAISTHSPTECSWSVSGICIRIHGTVCFEVKVLELRLTAFIEIKGSQLDYINCQSWIE